MDTASEDFRAAVAEVGRAASGFVGGDAQPYRSCWAHGEEVTLFGAWGAHERGWHEVGPRLDWAAARFAAGRTDQTVLTMGASGDFGYTVSLEQGQAQVVGETAAAPMLLRVTHVYRRVNGAWKVVHRHADAITDKIAPAAVLAPAPS